MFESYIENHQDMCVDSTRLADILNIPHNEFCLAIAKMCLQKPPRRPCWCDGIALFTPNFPAGDILNWLPPYMEFSIGSAYWVYQVMGGEKANTIEDFERLLNQIPEVT